MVLADAQKQAILDVSSTGEAFGKLRPLFAKAQLPTPFHFPSEASWNQNTSDEPDFDDDMNDINDSGDASDYSDDEKKAVYAGTAADVGTLRATCAFLIHGDPNMHKMTSAALNWAAKQKGKLQ